MRITTPAVDSSAASRWTLRRRSSEIGVVRDIISKGSSSAQLEDEVKMLTKTERESLLDSAIGDSSSVAIPAEDVLAMKADLCLTWNKLRVFRRSVKTHTMHTSDQLW